MEELRRLIDEVLESGVEELSSLFIRALGSDGRLWIIVKKYYVHGCGEGCYEQLILPRGWSEKSRYRVMRYCPRCGSWFPLYDGSEDDYILGRTAKNN